MSFYIQKPFFDLKLLRTVKIMLILCRIPQERIALLEMLNKFRKYTIVIWVQPKHTRTLTFP
jgi:uncharacterized membrane protein